MSQYGDRNFWNFYFYKYDNLYLNKNDEYRILKVHKTETGTSFVKTSDVDKIQRSIYYPKFTREYESVIKSIY